MPNRLQDFCASLGRLGRMAAIAGLAAALAACTSAGGSSTALLSNATRAESAPMGGIKVEKRTYTAADFTSDGYCPPLNLRSGTEALPVYEKGHDGEQDYVRYQASINKTARECRLNGDTLTIKVGIDGRLVAGPKGGAGTMSLPVRIVVVKQLGGKGPLYSKLFKVPVSVTAPTFSADFSQVIENISFKIGPDDRDLIVYVGFDDGKKAPSPSG